MKWPIKKKAEKTKQIAKRISPRHLLRLERKKNILVLIGQKKREKKLRLIGGS
jgi:hypothetical protein